MGFILGVLVVGALLSVIFGRRVGAMFVTGTATVVGLFFGILLILLSPLIWDYMHEPSHVQPASNHGDYEPGYSYNTTYPSTGNGTAYSTTGSTTANQTQTAPQPSYQPASQPTNSNEYSGAAIAPSSTMPLPPSTPKIGISDGGYPSPEYRAALVQGCVGDLILAVAPGSPAEAKGLRAGDIIMTAATDGFADHKLLSPQYALDSFERDHPALTQPIVLVVYRPSDRSTLCVHVMPQ